MGAHNCTHIHERLMVQIPLPTPRVSFEVPSSGSVALRKIACPKRAAGSKVLLTPSNPKPSMTAITEVAGLYVLHVRTKRLPLNANLAISKMLVSTSGRID